MTHPPYPAAFEGNWCLISADATALLSERIYDFHALPRLRKIKEIRVTSLPFFAGQLLCDIYTTRMRQPDEWVSCLYGPDGVRLLTGKSDVIHSLNAKAKPDLSDLSMEEAYLKFFCRFVHGVDGPFEIITDAGQISGADAAKQTPLSHDSDTSTWSATVHYGSSLFQATLNVEADGHVKMEDDTPIASAIHREPDVIFDGASRRLRPSEDV